MSNGGGGGGLGKSVGFAILGLISFTFGLLVFLYILQFFPAESVSNFAGAALEAGTAILSSVPDIINEVTSSFGS